MIIKIKIFGIFDLLKTTKDNTYILEEDIYEAKNPIIALLVKLTNYSGQYYILKNDKLYNYWFRVTVGLTTRTISVSENATTEPKELINKIIDKTYENIDMKKEFSVEYDIQTCLPTDLFCS